MDLVTLAMAAALGGGSGGGGSSGGVLVVSIDMETMALDKTYNELYAALASGMIPVLITTDDGGGMPLYLSHVLADLQYLASFSGIGEGATQYDFSADTADEPLVLDTGD